eukprot:TRINITY_DN5679_c0_g1_i2.p1 TRINITY_DN5679_c0_g1~~TRINITY_DN5679_c0_g1_i2.p1  ORF type:complete len:216 (+),score=34.80 TRINITY_DN5679_c0_g1_i2:612-1259(+)
MIRKGTKRSRTDMESSQSGDESNSSEKEESEDDFFVSNGGTRNPHFMVYDTPPLSPLHPCQNNLPMYRGTWSDFEALILVTEHHYNEEIVKQQADNDLDKNTTSFPAGTPNFSSNLTDDNFTSSALSATNVGQISINSLLSKARKNRLVYNISLAFSNDNLANPTDTSPCNTSVHDTSSSNELSSNHVVSVLDSKCPSTYNHILTTFTIYQVIAS